MPTVIHVLVSRGVGGFEVNSCVLRSLFTASWGHPWQGRGRISEVGGGPNHGGTSLGHHPPLSLFLQFYQLPLSISPGRSPLLARPEGWESHSWVRAQLVHGIRRSAATGSVTDGVSSSLGGLCAGLSLPAK